MAITQLSESFQHANLRLWFGRWGERLWISPRFHRRHHTIGFGHETTPAAISGTQLPDMVSGASQSDERNAVLGGHNFGVLLPWWDMLFGTADFDRRYDSTGVRDQAEPDQHGRLRDYGDGFWSQQWRGLLRLAGRA